MKSGDNDALIRVASAILTDAQRAYPAMRGVELDKARLSACARSRGLTFFTLDLPTLDSLVLDSFKTGHLGSGFLAKGRSRYDQRPRFLHGLWSLCYDANRCLLRDADPLALFFLRQVFCLGKKLAVACSPDKVSSTLEDYYAIERRLVPPALTWQEDSIDAYKAPSFVSNFSSLPLPLFEDEESVETIRFDRFLSRLDSVSAILTSDLGYFDVFDAERSGVGRFKHGPGAVADGSSRTFKYVFPHWPEKLDGCFPFDYCGRSDLNFEQDYYPSRSEPSSRLLAVPKTAKGPRLIASEPIAHQWCQQRVSTWLATRFRESITGLFVDLSDQALSQELVRSASQRRDLATLDLSSASDRVSCRHIESLFRANGSVLEALHAVRTRTVFDTIGPNGTIGLKKFAAMGSALTFPIQCLFFLSVCLASCGASDRKSITLLKGKVRVFGDDLIVPVDGYAELVSNLTRLGLVVNQSKSFSSGGFRESCGLDAYSGVDITPVKPKTLVPTSPETFMSLVDTSNNFFRKGCWVTADVIGSLARFRGLTPYVVKEGSGLPGLISYSGEGNVPLRWNRDLHRHERPVVTCRTRQKRRRQDNKAALLQYFTERPSPERAWTSGVAEDARKILSRAWVGFGETARATA